VIPVDQTRFYEPDLPVDEQRGNCFQAVVASVLELPLDEVPHFVQDHVDTAGLRHWWDSFVAFVRTQGWAVHAAVPVTDYPEQHLIVAGPSPRGTGDDGLWHAVIYRGGEMVHDPHPDRTGLRGGLQAAGSAWGLHRLDSPAVTA
jgi:hypothetical protein